MAIEMAAIGAVAMQRLIFDHVDASFRTVAFVDSIVFVPYDHFTL
jgi:hypothetical protein